MATVKNSITLQDKFTPVLGSIIKSMKSTMKVMESLDKAANNGATSKAFKAAQKDINSAENALKKFNSEMNELGSLTDKAKGGFGGLGGAAVVANQAIELIGKGVNAVKGFADMADSYNGIAARLNGIVKPGENVVQVQENIFQAAQRAGADMSTFSDTVGKFGNMAGHAFKDTGEIIRFTELINKAIATAGTEGAGADAAIFQLTQGLASGTLRGEELNSILEQGTPIAQAIAKSFGDDTVAGLRKYAEQGLLTADVVKNAIFGSEEAINEKFNKMPQTFKKAMIRLTNTAMKALSPLFELFSKIVNSKGFNNTMADIGRGIAWVVGLIGKIIEVIQSLVAFVQRNKQPIIGAFTAIGIVVGVILVQKIKAATLALYAQIKAWIINQLTAEKSAYKTMIAWMAAYWPILAMAATIGVLIALWDQLGSVGQAVGILIVIILGVIQLALLGVSWPIIAIIALLAVVASGFIFFGDTATQVMGVIVGSVFWLGAVFANIGIGIANGALSTAEFFSDTWNSAVYGVQKAFYSLKTTSLKIFTDLVNGVLQKLNGLIGNLNKIPGVNIGTFGEVDFTGAAGSAPTKAAKADFGRFDYVDTAAAYNKGKGYGEAGGKAIQKGIGNLVDSAKKIINQNDAEKNADKQNYGAAAGPSGTASDPVNTKVKGDVSITEEDIKMLRDIARIDYVNKFTTLKPNMQVSFGDVRETADTKKIMGVLEDMWEEARASALV